MSKRTYHPHNGVESVAHVMEIVYVVHGNIIFKTRVLGIYWDARNQCLEYFVANGQMAFGDDGTPIAGGQRVSKVYREMPQVPGGHLQQLSPEIEALL